MSPTLATLGLRAHKTFTICLLSLWIIAALGFTALEFTDNAWHFLDSFLSTSLLTYLVCRFIVVFQEYPRDGSMAYRLTSAHHRQSRREALATILFCCGWMYEVIWKLVIMFFFTMICGAMFVHDAFGDTMITMENDSKDEPNMDVQKALESMEKAKHDLGFDPVKQFGWVSPKVLLFCLCLGWVTIVTLGLYILRITGRLFKVLFRLPSEEPAAHKAYTA
ncbi:uncharacterized protein N7503_000434 [Penicillium pulvis]|uniref:uncharacterized protein n=1 Tax=Penicillium pulvis TaxID=1562058 RepID=UPI002548FA50|nr:uncharacterized protein N7503_000434 [Penicillium pulvis]KAJ5813684.1 hypothetical protein N7503_000434 [Penicillium pulvis]